MAKLNSIKHATPRTLPRILIAGLLVLMLVLGLVLNHTGQRFWQELPPVPNLGALREIRNTGINVPGWESTDQAKLRVGSHDWSIQTMEAPGQRVGLLMLFPQTGPQETPGVEWSDVDGFYQWKPDQVRSLTFTTDDPATTVRARVFIARDTAASRVVPSRQTVAVAQWYAFDDGGHFSTAQWFWRDQWAQLQQQRLPWVAVSLRLPVDPKSTLDDVIPQVIELSEAIQTSLVTLMNEPRN